MVVLTAGYSAALMGAKKAASRGDSLVDMKVASLVVLMAEHLVVYWVA